MVWPTWPLALLHHRQWCSKASHLLYLSLCNKFATCFDDFGLSNIRSSVYTTAPLSHKWSMTLSGCKFLGHCSQTALDLFSSPFAGRFAPTSMFAVCFGYQTLLECSWVVVRKKAHRQYPGLPDSPAGTHHSTSPCSCLVQVESTVTRQFILLWNKAIFRYREKASARYVSPLGCSYKHLNLHGIAGQLYLFEHHHRSGFSVSK